MRKPDWQFENSMDAIRRAAIVEALAACDQSVVAAAARLRIGRSTLYRLIEKFAIGAPASDLPVGYDDDVAEPAPADDRRGKVVEIEGKWFMVR